MEIVILIPAVLCLLVLVQSGPQSAFIKVCLPTLMILPTYYFWKVPLLPPIDVAKAVMVPLGIVILYQNAHRWRFTRTDLWLGLFVLSAGLSEVRVGPLNAAIIAIFTQTSSAVVPYIAGKVLIEQPGKRIATAKRFVALLAVIAVISMYEYRMKDNPFRLVWAHVFPDQNPGWTTQVRWGFGRVAGPYAQSELAGMILLIGIILSLWLSSWHHWEPRLRWLRAIPIRKSLIISGTLFACLFTTQARGPWLGTTIAYLVAVIGRSKRVVRTALIVGGLLLTIGVPGYLAGKKYLSGPTSSDEQQTAQYRQQLLDNYIPIAKAGGFWGWGEDFPRVYLQPSIDNQYLFTWITQGYLGALLFLLLIGDSALSLVRAGMAAKRREDRHFIFSLLGILAGLVVTLGTVFLGEQTYEIFFILIGWSQAVGAEDAEIESMTRTPMIRVYT